MTQEEIAKVKAMSREQRRRHFKPLFMANKLTFREYEAIVEIETTLLRMETLANPQKDTSEPKNGGLSRAMERTRPLSPPNGEDAIAELARQFGGYVVSDTPTGEQGELVKEDNQKKVSAFYGG